MTHGDEIAFNVRAHDRVSAAYEAIHGEIFNAVEQDRLRHAVARAVDGIQTGSSPTIALDFGCGTGNLTGHLLAFGLRVVSADVATRFLDLVRERYGATGRLELLVLNGRDLRDVTNERFDFVAAYSVLHHIPDYLAAVEELIRVTKPGGVVYLDHEVNDTYWSMPPVYAEWLEQAPKPTGRWRRFFRPQAYVRRVREFLNPRYQPEGDIHTWPDDHIEWHRIRALFLQHEFEILIEEDYLLYRAGYELEVYRHYSGRCADMRLVAARKPR
ncbi:MAG: class I SAM-dependent methyltransferase [Gemmatimonadaceae bacterium]